VQLYTLDFDGDGYLSSSDMDTALNYITNYELDREELDYITAKIIGTLYLATITVFMEMKLSSCVSW